MAVPTSGRIKMSELVTEFGANAKKMSNLYKGGSLVANNIVNTNVPTSGRIKITEMYGTTGTETRDIQCNWKYNNDSNNKSSYGVRDVTDNSPQAYTSTDGTMPVVFSTRFRAGTGFITSLVIRAFWNEDVGSATDLISVMSSADGNFSSETQAVKITAASDSSSGGYATYTLTFSAAGVLTGCVRSDNSGGAQPQAPTNNFNSGHKWFRIRVNNGQDALGATSKGGSIIQYLNADSAGNVTPNSAVNISAPTTLTV